MFLIVWLAFMACGFLGWYFSHRARHKEKLMLIEKGVSPEDLRKKEHRSKLSWAKVGIVVLGLSIGLLSISIFITQLHLINDSPATIMAILGICGGTALVLANRIDHKKND